MHAARSGDRNVVGGDRHLPDRGIGFLRRGDRYTKDRWNVSGGSVTPPVTGLNDGDLVTTWKDSSTSLNDGTNTGTARPTFKANILNAKPVVRYASSQSLLLSKTTGMDPSYPWTSFVVMRYNVADPSLCSLVSFDGAAAAILYRNSGGGQILISDNAIAGYNITAAYAGAFHIFTTQTVLGLAPILWVDGTPVGLTSIGGGGPNPFFYIGNGVGDIAEVVHYKQIEALRAKLLLVLTVLVQTGQIPSTEEADALFAAGDFLALEAYLIDNGVSVQEAKDALTPMAAGDRANIEKYLGTKYGIPVAGGSAVQPDTLTGLVGWWKADSLGAASPPFDPTTIAGLKGWWKADAITVGGLLKDALEKGDSIQPFAGLNPLATPPDGTRIPTWPDSSSSGNDQSGGATYKTNIINGKPVLRFDGSTNDAFYSISSMGIAQPFTVFLVGKPPDSPPSVRCAFLWSILLTLAVTLEQGSGHYFLYEALTPVEDTIDSSAAFHVYSGVFASAVATGYRDGAMRMSGPVGTGGIGTLTFFWDGGSGHFPGDMAEILVYNSALSTTDRQNVENYLKTKYGL